MAKYVGKISPLRDMFKYPGTHLYNIYITYGPKLLTIWVISGHLSRTKWRTIWNEAIEKSGIGWYPKTHDLRHANATQLLKKGVDVHEVKERLGHQSITTTERYLHRIRHQQSKAGELADEYLLGER